MSNRPVLAMSFYDQPTGSARPYSEMVSQAYTQLRARQQRKQKVITNTMGNITQIVNNFFPSQDKSNTNKSDLKKKQRGKSYSLDMNYFAQMQQNLDQVNSYIQSLEKEL